MSKTYNNLDEAYKDLVDSMTNTARRHIFNTDYAIDAVHDAFTKTVEYVSKKPDTKISEFIIQRELMRACRRINKKYSPEISSGLMNLQVEVETD